MAVNVNTVYQTVLFILNKEQRGYMTPAEFNSVARQVQLEIFEKYFEDLNQYLRAPRLSTELADRVKVIEERISEFETTAALQPGYLLPADLHRFGTMQYQPNGGRMIECEESTQHQYYLAQRSKLTQPTSKHPIFTRRGNVLQVYPTLPETELLCYYVRKPSDPIWAFTIDPTNGAYVWVDPDGVIPPPPIYPTPPGTSVHFEISDQDQTELVLEILMYAGIIIRDPSIVQAASSQIQQEEVTEKK